MKCFPFSAFAQSLLLLLLLWTTQMEVRGDSVKYSTRQISHHYSLLFRFPYKRLRYNYTLHHHIAHNHTVGPYLWWVVFYRRLLRRSRGWDDWSLRHLEIPFLRREYDSDLFQSPSPSWWIPRRYPATQILYWLPIGVLLSQYIPGLFVVQSRTILPEWRTLYIRRVELWMFRVDLTVDTSLEENASR